MKISYCFQPKDKDCNRPNDEYLGDVKTEFMLKEHEPSHPIPCVGDHVVFYPQGTVYLVKSRLFSYENNHCDINIVVEPIDHSEVGALIKE